MRAFRLEKGGHPEGSYELCVMEATALVAGEPHSAQPKTACPVMTLLCMALNDLLDSDIRDTLLADLPWRLQGTRSAEHYDERDRMLSDWLIDRYIMKPIERHCTRCHVGSLAKAIGNGGRAWQLRHAPALRQLIDRMIALTEPREIVPIRNARALAVV